MHIDRCVDITIDPENLPTAIVQFEAARICSVGPGVIHISLSDCRTVSCIYNSEIRVYETGPW